MFRDFHVIESGEDSFLFFPETFKFYKVSREDGEACRRLLSEGAPVGAGLEEIFRKEASAKKYREKEDDFETDSLCLYMAHDCNLSCTYCYNGGGRSLNPSMMMSEEVAEAAFRRFFTTPGKRYAVGFYGGEPLMNFQAIKRAVEAGERLKRERGIEISYSVTTNGTIMDDEVISFLDKHFSTVTLSIDGPAEVNDVHRKASGYSPYKKAMDNLNRLLGAKSSVRVTLRSTVTGDGVPLLEETIGFLSRASADGFSIAPVNTGRENPAHISDAGYEEFIGRFTGLTRRYFSDLVKGTGQGFKYTFNTVVNILSKRRFVRHCDAGKNPAVAADGSLYACHGLVGIDEFHMGSVKDGPDERFGKVKETFAGLTVNRLEECSRCWARYLCGGSCYAHAYLNTGSLYRPDPRHCMLFKINAEAVIGEFLKAMNDPGKRDSLYGNIKKALKGRDGGHEE